MNRELPEDDPRHGINGYTHYRCRCDRCRAANTARCGQARQRRELTPGDPRHGTPNGYFNYNCRCEACRAAGSEANRVGRSERSLDGHHGTTTGYQYGCRCEACRAAIRVDRRRRQQNQRQLLADVIAERDRARELAAQLEAELARQQREGVA
jgi:hypothetical protein